MTEPEEGRTRGCVGCTLQSSLCCSAGAGEGGKGGESGVTETGGERERQEGSARSIIEGVGVGNLG